MAYPLKKMKYANLSYTIVVNESSSNQCVFKRGSISSEGIVINTPQLHVPLSGDVFDMFIDKNVYKINVRETLKLDQLYEILRFDAEIISIPFVCKKRFSKKYFTKYLDKKYLNLTSDFVNRMRLVSTPDNKNETLEITIDTSKLPKKIKGYKVIKLGEEIIVSVKTMACDVSKFETKNNLSLNPVDTTSRITKRKFEVPYPIKFAAGIVAFFGILEVGSALISKVINKIK